MSSKRKKHKEHSKHQDELVETEVKKHECDGCSININISYTINIGNKEIHVDQRAEGGGQINKHVGTNANQGGQNAIDHSSTRNDQSNFADGNGRSGIAGNDNDEAGGQQGIKVRDSIVKKSIIESSSEHSEGLAQQDEEN
ncbi:hypothetical protein [Bacillus marasmi]|uniref:hypothetical protein n=1 Tax=Bacillus marasmi TaxID=1926279 RepID=UPI001FE70DDD|nr:hypothetical protein [Bacillus marasmi]